MTPINKLDNCFNKCRRKWRRSILKWHFWEVGTHNEERASSHKSPMKKIILKTGPTQTSRMQNAVVFSVHRRKLQSVRWFSSVFGRQRCRAGAANKVWWVRNPSSDTWFKATGIGCKASLGLPSMTLHVRRHNKKQDSNSALWYLPYWFLHSFEWVPKSAAEHFLAMVFYIPVSNMAPPITILTKQNR